MEQGAEAEAAGPQVARADVAVQRDHGGRHGRDQWCREAEMAWGALGAVVSVVAVPVVAARAAAVPVVAALAAAGLVAVGSVEGGRAVEAKVAGALAGAGGVEAVDSGSRS